MRRGFTLLEILTVVAIIAIMVTASVVSVRQGQGFARIRGATRDIYATIRHARSMALVSQQPSIITYSTVHEGGEVVAKIEITTAKMFNDTAVKVATTLSGETVRLVEEEEPPAEEVRTKSHTVDGEAPTVTEGSGGQSVEDILFAPISTDVVRGIRIKVTKEGETLEGVTEERAKPKVSVFSNVDYLLGKFHEKKASEAKAKGEGEGSGETSSTANGLDDQEPVSVVWEANGRTEPHRVWIFPDGSDPEKGLSIKVDRFGGAKVVGSGGEEDD